MIIYDVLRVCVSYVCSIAYDMIRSYDVLGISTCVCVSVIRY